MLARSSAEMRVFHNQRGMARTHLQVGDAENIHRTWQNVMDAIIRTKTGNTKIRWERAAKSKSFDGIRNLVVAETKANEFLVALDKGTVSTNVFLRRLHNFALDMNWLLAPVIGGVEPPVFLGGGVPEGFAIGGEAVFLRLRALAAGEAVVEDLLAGGFGKAQG